MKILSYIRKYYVLPQCVVFVIFCVLTGCIPAIQIFVESKLIDGAIQGVSHKGISHFVEWLAIYIVLLLCNSVFESLLQRGVEKHALIIGRKFDEIRLSKANRVAFHITESQAFHELFEKAGKAPELDSTFYRALQDTIIGSTKIVTSLIVLFTIDLWTSFSLLVLLVFGIVMNENAAKNADGFWGQYIQNMRHANYLSSLLLHREYASERKIFDFSQEISNRYEADFSEAVNKNSELGKKRFHAEAAVTVFSALYSIATILLLLRPLNNGWISLGTFGAAFSSSNKLRNVGSQIYGAIFSMISSFNQMSGFFSFIQLEDEAECSNQESIDLTVGVEFRNVSFKYPDSDTLVLDNVSFTLLPGVHYALVGENGSGKTTLVKLLVGLYRPTEGKILVGGKNIQEMSVNERKHLFSVMFQDFYQYPITVKENVSLCAPKPLDNDRVMDVLRLLGLNSPFLSEGDGLDRNLKLLKNDGIDISGGEWQKLVAARCVLSSAPIAILDEPNAALDPKSEEAFYSVCKETLADKTTLFISHRLGSVRSANKIMVLRDRHLIAMDSHAKLMKSCAYYKSLFETQRGLYYEA